MSKIKSSSCPHVTNVGSNSWGDIFRKKAQQEVCSTCNVRGPNLWLCMHSRCLYVGCGESASDHSSAHSESSKHCLTLNLTTMRIWCYLCETEVYREGNQPPLIMQEKLNSVSSSGHSSPARVTSVTPTPTATPEESDTDEDDDLKPRGLTGLQNIGNTCYMNAAIQALSNCPPLTRFFMDCNGFVKSDKKPMLAKSYQKLMQEMWHKKRPGYVVPSSVAHGIKIVHPMFRGYTQQDTQEFLRCFMDQLHEELKYPITNDMLDSEEEEEVCQGKRNVEEYITSKVKEESVEGQPVVMETNSQSDTEYETCDSGMSSERSSVENNHDPSQDNISGDEGVENVTAELARKNLDKNNVESNKKSSQVIRRSKREKNRVNPDEILPDPLTKVVSSVKENMATSPKNPKEEKESANLANKKQSSNPVSETTVAPAGNMHIAVTDIDSGEFSDAVSELEPLQGGRSRTLSGRSRPSSDAEKVTVGGHVRSVNTANSTQSSTGKKQQRYGSVISDIFDGRLLSSVQCLTCERVSSTRETFQDLSLPIPSKDHIHMLHANQGPTSPKGTCGEVTLNQGWVSWMFSWMRSWFWGPTITLADCLAAFFSADELKGDNMYSCDKCKKLRNGVKYSKVMELPEILSVHLKRFRHEFMFSAKIPNYVSFPLDNLDMGPYLHKECKDLVTLYDLVAVICHHGTSGGGHYTAYALNYINEQWYEFDDQYVTEVDLQTVENCEAYVLFYRKKNDDMIQLRQKAQDIMTSAELSIMKFFVSKQWINKFNTFSDPGPISNNDFLCRHGGVPPHKYSSVNDLVQELPQPVWEFLHDTFGGGPAVNHLYQCVTCQNELEKLKARQSQEMATFIQLNNEFQSEENPSAIYAISMSWFKEWENFVRGKTDDPPGQIDNSKIAVTRAGQSFLQTNSDYGQLSAEMWKFLHNIYHGGPEVFIKESPPSLSSMATEVKVTEAGDVGVKVISEVK